MSRQHPEPVTRRLRPWLLALVLALCLLPARAEAGGFFLVTYGDGFKHLGEVPAAQKEAIRQATGMDPSVGYKYSYFGLFWVDLWTWGGEYCLYKDNTYGRLEPAQAAALLGVEEAALKVPLTYRYPPGLMIVLLLALLIGYAVIEGTLNMRKAEALLQDPRYQRALEILRDAKAPEGATWDEGRRQATAAATEYLVSQGVDGAAAARGVKLLELVHGPREGAKPEPPAAPPANTPEPPPADSNLPGPAAP